MKAKCEIIQEKLAQKEAQIKNVEIESQKQVETLKIQSQNQVTDPKIEQKLAKAQDVISELEYEKEEFQTRIKDFEDQIA